MNSSKQTPKGGAQSPRLWARQRPRNRANCSTNTEAIWVISPKRVRETDAPKRTHHLRDPLFQTCYAASPVGQTTFKQQLSAKHEGQQHSSERRSVTMTVLHVQTSHTYTHVTHIHTRSIQVTHNPHSSLINHLLFEFI